MKFCGGVINITLDGCSFDSGQRSNPNTAVYSNSPGTISIKNTTFNKISVGLNLNHKSSDKQTISVDGCTFTDCAIDSLPNHDTTQTYSAPIRIVAKEGAASNLKVTNTTFSYSPGSASQNGDILLNDGRYDAAEKQGTVTLAMTGTAATIMVQESGYYTDNGGINTDNGKTTTLPPMISLTQTRINILPCKLVEVTLPPRPLPGVFGTTPGGPTFCSIPRA